MNYETILQHIENVQCIEAMQNMRDNIDDNEIDKAEYIERIITITNSFSKHDLETSFYETLDKVHDELLEMLIYNMNLLDNTTYKYWQVYRRCCHIKRINKPKLTEEEKINNPNYILQLKMCENNKLLAQKSFNAGYKISGLYLSYYITNKIQRVEYCEKLLHELTDENEILQVKQYISRIKQR